MIKPSNKYYKLFNAVNSSMSQHQNQMARFVATNQCAMHIEFCDEYEYQVGTENIHLLNLVEYEYEY